ncbi:MAG: HAD-IB family phosphatase [Bacteroidetes bacterium]|nr:HAD-IB family phosphatase [Bacteroidota bacterium]
MNNTTIHPETLNIPENPARTLVLFDFDGTVSHADSLRRFLSCNVGYLKVLAGLPVVLLRFLYVLVFNKWGNGVAKQHLMSTYFAGRTRAEMEEMGKAFIPGQPDSLLNNQVLGWLRAYRQAGCTVSVVSASFDVWLSAFTAAENIQLICTRLEFKNERFTGRYATLNCNYEEKAHRVQAQFDLNQYDRIIAYGNSSGDHAMFGLATEAWKSNNKGVFERYK